MTKVIRIFRRGIFSLSLCLRGVARAALAAGAASAACAAACTVAAAGALARFPVTDHAADEQPHDQHDDCDQHDIDEIGRKPCKPEITSFIGAAAL